MSYTVLGFFENAVKADEAKSDLVKAGFSTDKIDYSPHKETGEHNKYNYQYQEDENTSNFWDWLFGDDTESRTKYSRLGSRSEMLTVYANTKEEAEKAQDIMDRIGAIDADEYDRTIAGYNQRQTAGLTENEVVDKDNLDTSIDVIKEEMHVGKETVETGGVTVRSRIIEKPVEENVRLRNERVYVKRNKVDRPASTTEFDNFYEGTISLTETEERPIVSKEARVVEEIELGKDVNVETATVKDTVRETEVDIDKDDTIETV